MYRLTALLALFTTVSATCYFPNGAVADLDTACTPNAIESACCFDNQACLSNGLCVSDPHDPENMRLHRGTCTDKQWKSGNCPKQCLDVDNNGVPVYSCNVTDVASYCCFDDCKCESPFEVFSFPPLKPADIYTVTIIDEAFFQTHVSTTSQAASIAVPVDASKQASASVTKTSIVTSVQSATLTGAIASATAPASEAGSSSLNTTAIGVGLGVGIPALAAAIVAAFSLWRRTRSSRPGDGTTERPSELANEESYAQDAKHVYYAQIEVPGNMAPSELPATQTALHELQSSSPGQWKGPEA